MSLTFFLISVGLSNLDLSVFMSVGLVRLFLTIEYYFRDLGGNQLQGTIPDVISTLVKLTRLYALTSF